MAFIKLKNILKEIRIKPKFNVKNLVRLNKYKFVGNDSGEVIGEYMGFNSDRNSKDKYGYQFRIQWGNAIPNWHSSYITYSPEEMNDLIKNYKIESV